MMRLKKLNRRRFLGGAMAATSAACSARKELRYLSEQEMGTLAAICDQIIPPDQDPGGAWAGVPNYIAKQLRGHFKEHFETYREGLAEADKRAGGNFASLSREMQLEVLKKMDADKPTKPFMALVIAHSMQGFYGSPRHGGNRDYCGWRMLGVSASPVRGRDQYDFTKGARS